MDQAGQVYCGGVRAAISAACSGAIFTVPAALGHTKPELSEAALGRLLVPVIALAEASIGHRPGQVKIGRPVDQGIRIPAYRNRYRLRRPGLVERSVLVSSMIVPKTINSVDLGWLPLPHAMVRR